MKIRYAAFTAQGRRLAETLRDALGGEIRADGIPIRQWTAENFAGADALVFVGAAGIAVRAIAPYVKSKAEDPAVVVIDECGQFAIPILSGHLGGANDLAREIARICGAQPVITTATDANGVFAVDEWAKRQGCAVTNPEKIKAVSGKLLAGGTVSVRSDWPICGTIPAGVDLCRDGLPDVRVTLEKEETDALVLVPRIAAMGIGCRRGTPPEAFEQALTEFLQEAGLWEQAIVRAASIDLKRDEPGLLEFCARHGWPLAFYTADELKKAGDGFTGSGFVQSVTGVDNVCERSAVLVSGGPLVRKKWAKNGITMALAVRPFSPDWRWQP